MEESAKVTSDPHRSDPHRSGPDRSGPAVGGPARRLPRLVQGALGAALAGVLALASQGGVEALAGAVLAAQVLLILGLLTLVQAPAAGGVLVISLTAGIASDLVVVTQDGDVDGLAGVGGLALVAALLHQLVRRNRSRVTESLADTLLVVVLVEAMACLPALRALPGGREAVLVALAAAAGALVAGRIGDLVLPKPALAVGASRGWAGLLLSLCAGAGVAAAVAGLDGVLAGRAGALLGLAEAAAVAAADLAVDLGGGELRDGWRDARKVAALRPVGAVLPYAALAPVALLAGRLVLP